MTDLEGFITRIEAQAKYERSKTSFIRDVDQARERGDTDFLRNFMVLMKDDTSMTGVDATKQALKDNDHLKPEWYVKESLLQTRYWMKGKKAKSNKRQSNNGNKNFKAENEEGTPDSHSPPKSADRYVALLEQTNADLRTQISMQQKMLTELSGNQQQSNVLMKSLTNLLSGNATEEAMVALGVLRDSSPLEKQPKNPTFVDVQPMAEHDSKEKTEEAKVGSETSRTTQLEIAFQRLPQLVGHSIT
jgi:hypothetical protein